MSRLTLNHGPYKQATRCISLGQITREEITHFQVFASRSHKDDLLTMLMAVDRKVQERNGHYLQTTETVNRGLNKRLFFNTGMSQCQHSCDYVGSAEAVGIHEKKCERRSVPCVSEDCSEELPLNGLFQHVNEEHVGKRFTVDSNGLINHWWWMSAGNAKELDITWVVPYYNFDGYTFIHRIVKRERIYYVYLRIVADEDSAKKFKVDIEVESKDGQICVKYLGAKVYPIDIPWWDAIEEGEGVLEFGQKMAEKLFHYVEGGTHPYNVNIKYAIKKL